MENIRNFCIIAHIDHGKSTLADRMLLLTHTIDERKFRDQVLDAMDLERERGITIKCHPVTMHYKARNGQSYDFNLIDTPGHVDFSYEVSRSMAACEGAILVIDATQGVEAQTVANARLAMQRNLTIIPVINKIDLPNANISEIARQIEDILAINSEEKILISAKTGHGVAELMEDIVKRIPPPKTELSTDTPCALIFDSSYDTYRGVVMYVRIVDGIFEPKMKIKLMSNNEETEIKEVGTFHPHAIAQPRLYPGQVGYIVGNIREPSVVKVGDTITSAIKPAQSALPGFKEIKPVVFSSIFPINTSDFEKMRDSMEKLRLNDSSLSFHPENSAALGFGFRCGFLGILHMEIVIERLRREFDIDIISSHPGVNYKVNLRNGNIIDVDNPQRLPEPVSIDSIQEPIVQAYIICPNESINEVMTLIKDRRGDLKQMESLDSTRLMLTAILPLNEILTDFHDNLKSVTRGYSSMDYEPLGYQESDIVKMDILLNGQPVDALSLLVHRSKAESRGRQICRILKESIPSHLFTIAVQAAIHNKVIARETIRAYRKDVTAKLYGGDYTRKMKVLEKQKAGKKRMKMLGKVSIPQEAFVAVLKNR